MNVDKATIDKNTSTLEKIMNFFKKSQVKTVSNKGNIVSFAPLAKGVSVTNDADADLEDGDYEVTNEGKKVVYNVKGGMVENIMSEDDEDCDNDDDIQNKAILNSVNLKVTNKVEAAGIAKVVSNHIEKINTQNTLIAELTERLSVTNKAYDRDKETIKAEIKSTFTPDGSQRSNTANVNSANNVFTPSTALAQNAVKRAMNKVPGLVSKEAETTETAK